MQSIEHEAHVSISSSIAVVCNVGAADEAPHWSPKSATAEAVSVQIPPTHTLHPLFRVHEL